MLNKDFDGWWTFVCTQQTIFCVILVVLVQVGINVCEQQKIMLGHTDLF